MAEIKLFRLGSQVEELKSHSAVIEKELQNKIEKNMFEFFGVHFLDTEYRIDIGDDVSESTLKLYSAFKKIKNFATMEIYKSNIRLNVKLNPNDYTLSENLRDVSEIGHWGCGDLQLIIKSEKDVPLAKELIQKSYEEN